MACSLQATDFGYYCDRRSQCTGHIKNVSEIGYLVSLNGNFVLNLFLNLRIIDHFVSKDFYL